MALSITDHLSVYFCGHERCLPGHFWGPAIRPHYLLHIVINGCGIFRRNDHAYHLKTGSAFLIHPGETAFYQADENDPWEYVWVGFDGDLISEILKETCFSSECVFMTDSPRLASLAFSILHCFSGPDHNPISLSGCLLQILGEAVSPASAKAQSYSQKYLETAVDYIDNNYGYPIKISDIAAFIGIDRTYLYRIFMENRHISPQGYLLNVRIRNAAELLRNPSFTVTEVAFSCGFKDAASFCSQFKKFTGQTPRGYRKAFSPSAPVSSQALRKPSQE